MGATTMITQEAELDLQNQAAWKRALVSAERKNWGYVIDQMLPVVIANPAFLEGRRLLRGAEGALAGDSRKVGFGLAGGLFKSSAKKPPLEQLADLEQNVFRKDPFSLSANEQLYDLAMQSHFPELAAFALETIRQGHPQNTRNLHKLAGHYMDSKLPEKAGEVFAAILKVDPRDMDAAKGEKDAAALTSIQQQWEGRTFAETIKSTAEAADLEISSRQGMTRGQLEQLLARLVARYEADPTDVNVVKQMAETYEKLGQEESALLFYDYALKLQPGDVALQHTVDKLRDRVQEEKIAAFEREIESRPHAPDVEDKRSQLAEIRREHASALISNAKTRVDRNPTDKGLRYDLGVAYHSAGMLTEAIRELQQARANPGIRHPAMLLLGRCFTRKNMHDLAQDCLTELVSELTVMDDLKKEVLHELAGVLDKMRDRSGSLKALKQIYNIDSGYKDVAERVEASYA